MSYGGLPQFQPPKTLTTQEQQARAKQIATAPATIARETTPSFIATGTPQEAQLRATAAELQQQAYQKGGFSQIGASVDPFAALRAEALTTGSFSYGAPSAVSALYSPPPSYIDTLGRTVTRAGATAAPAAVAGAIHAVTAPSPLGISPQTLAQSDVLRAELGLPPLEATTPLAVAYQRPAAPAPKADIIEPTAQTSKSISSVLPSVSPIDISPATLAASNRLRASLNLPPLESVAGVTVGYERPSPAFPSVLTFGQLAPISIRTATPSESEALGKLGDFFDSVRNNPNYSAINVLDNNKNVVATVTPDQAGFDKARQLLESSQGLTVASVVNPAILSAEKGQEQQQQIQLGKIISDAKNSGALSILITDSSGKTLDSIPINEASTILPLAVNTLQGQGKAISLQYTPEAVTTYSQTIYTQKNPILSAIGGFLAGPAELGTGVLAAVSKATGLTIGPFTPTTTQEQTGEILAKTFGTAAAEPLQTITDYFGTGKVSPSEIASLIGTGGFLAVGLGGGVKAIPKIPSATEAISSLIARTQAGKIATAIGKGIGTKPVGPEIQKGSKYIEYSYSTEPREGKVTVKPAEVGQPAVAGIGPTGEKVLSLTPAEQVIPAPQVTTEKQASNILQAFINPKGTTLFVRTATQENLTPQRILVKNIEPSLAKSLGLTRVANTNYYIGKATAKVVDQISQAQAQGRLQPVTDFFEYGTKDISKQAGQYAKLVDDPSGYSKDLLQEYSRPNVVRYYEGLATAGGRGRGAVGGTKITGISVGDINFEQALIKAGLLAARSTAQRARTTIKPFGAAAGPSKTVAGGAAKAEALQKIKATTEDLAKGLASSGVKVRVPADVFGPVATPEQLKERVAAGSKAKVTTETELVRYPSGTELRINLPTGLLTGEKTKQVQREGQVQVPDLLTETSQNLEQLTKNVGITLPRVIPKEVEERVGGLGIIEIPQPITAVKTGLGVVQKTGEIYQIPTPSELTIPLPKTPPPPTETILFPSGGGYEFPYGGILQFGKKRTGRYSPAFFIYSVNPNIAGAIAQAGLPEKIVVRGLGGLSAFEAKFPKIKGIKSFINF